MTNSLTLLKALGRMRHMGKEIFLAFLTRKNKKPNGTHLKIK